MGRIRGTRLKDYDAKRTALLQAFQARLIAADQPPPSLRELAAAAGVTLPTVRHYFGSRQEVIVALIEHLGREGAQHLAHSATGLDDFAASTRALVEYVVAGFSYGLSEIHALGLREGLGDSRIGPAYLDALFDPTIEAAARRLAGHQQAGQMIAIDPRDAALMLLSPIFMAMLHQRELGGGTAAPLDIARLIDTVVATFVRGTARAQAAP